MERLDTRRTVFVLPGRNGQREPIENEVEGTNRMFFGGQRGNFLFRCERRGRDFPTGLNRSTPSFPAQVTQVLRLRPRPG